MTSNKEPFWKDKPDNPTVKPPSLLTYGVTLLRIGTTLFILGIAFYALYLISHILALVLLTFLLLGIGLIIYNIKKKRDAPQKIPLIQENAPTKPVLL